MKDILKIINALSNYLNQYNTSEDQKVTIIVDKTIEREHYFVFFYDSEKYIKEGDISYALAGNAPVIVNKKTGEYYFTGTAYPIEFYMDQYERTVLNSK